MRKFSLAEIENLPEIAGVFYFLNEKNKIVFVGIAESLRQDVWLILSEKDFLRNEIGKIKTVAAKEKNLINVFAEIVRAGKPLYNFNFSEQRHFPHLKITNEKFPRLLVTRKIENDEADYFGAFLPETFVRLLLDFLNRIFQLRSCEIIIDGNFNFPCTQFYEKRCVAPCVENLCNYEKYIEIVGLLKLFLANKRDDLEENLFQKIKLAAEILDFETAGDWRDILINIQEVWREKDWNFRLDDAVDSFEIEEKDGRVFIYAVSQRGRKILGKRAFVFENVAGFNQTDVLTQIIWQFYEFYAPKEIRVSTDFPNRKFLAEVLSRRENRKIKINVIAQNSKKITAQRAFARTKFEFDFRQIKRSKTVGETKSELRKELGLSSEPARIEAFDVAHISGTDFVAAKSVWENGKFIVKDYEFWFLKEKSELKTLEKGIVERFKTSGNLPDLILIDGAKPHLNAALKAVEKIENRKFSIVSAVKPPQRHNEISHFITENGETIKMKPESDAFQTLVRLRNEAHELANTTHRTRRDTAHFYEAAAVMPSINEKERRRLLQKYNSLKSLKSASEENLIEMLGAEKAKVVFGDLQNKNESEKIEPLIVPIRFDDENGDARDLQPISKTRK